MQKHDDFDESGRAGALGRVVGALDRDGQIRARKPTFIFLILGMLVALLGALLWYSYPRQSAHMDEMAAPLIRADAGPIKVAPDDPGGMEIPYRGSTLFESMRGGQAGGKVESLLPPVEAPVDTEKMFAGLNTRLESETPEIIEDVAEPVAAVEDLTETVVPETQKVEIVTLPAPPEKIAVKIAEEVPAKTPAPVASPVSSETHFVQLASIRDQGEAAKAWGALQKEFSGLLDGFSYRALAADIPGKGTYYRIQAGPMDESAARRLCDSIKARKKEGCLVVRR